MLLAKNDNAVETILPPTVLVCTPLPTSLFCGLIFDELEIAALSTVEFDCCEFTSPNELIDVKEGAVPTQLTTKELWILENASSTLSFAKKILKRVVN